MKRFFFPTLVILTIIVSACGTATASETPILTSTPVNTFSEARETATPFPPTFTPEPPKEGPSWVKEPLVVQQGGAVVLRNLKGNTLEVKYYNTDDGPEYTQKCYPLFVSQNINEWIIVPMCQYGGARYELGYNPSAFSTDVIWIGIIIEVAEDSSTTSVYYTEDWTVVQQSAP